MNDAYRKGLKAALKAIADLPTPEEPAASLTISEAISAGQEDAYRAIEAKLK